MANSAMSGDWLLAEELFERGDRSFVEVLRRIDDANALGGFAARWIGDKRPEARKLLLDYLDRPLNAYRHEALVKRLFKLAEAANDDELMGRFLVALDRSVRRASRRRRYGESTVVETEKEANAIAAAWRDRGMERVGVWQSWDKKYQIGGWWTANVLRNDPNTTMPRGTLKSNLYPFSVPDWVFSLNLIPARFRGIERVPDAKRKDLERFRLFSLPTRFYLRRRAWRYFRKLGQRHPDRYLPAVVDALTHYRDDDVANGPALLDNWGLMHILFRFSPCLVRGDRGWNVAEGHSLSELEPAPKYARLWNASPRVLVDLLHQARCRAVRGWSVQMIRRDLAAVLPLFPLEERLALLGDDDPEVVALISDLIRDDPGLKAIAPSRWLTLLETSGAAAIETVCELIGQYVSAEQITIEQAVSLATSRPLPIARLGLRWIQSKTPRDEEECRTLLGLIEAESEPLRREIARAAREALARSGRFDPGWVLEWLDSRHEEIRTEGWAWFLLETRARGDITLWQRLLESPYDDVRLALVGELESRTRRLDMPRIERGVLNDDLLELLWASVLLNVRRGSRAKPVVVQQLVRRIETHPAELPRLLPLFAVALRSVRGPEWRAGLAAVVSLADRDESAAKLIHEAFPELQGV